MKYYILLALALIIGVTYALPQPIGYINDFANILPDRANFDEGLAAYEKNTTIEVAVVTLDNVPEGYTLFDYGVELFKKWGIGKKGEDNGILVLIVRNGTVGNRMRIELGWGIQGYITGAEAGAILDRAMPYYNRGDYQSALDTILLGLSDQLTNYVPGKYVPKSQTIDIVTSIVLSNLPLFIFFIIIIISVATSNRCPYCFGPLKCSGDECVCKKCGRKVSRKKRYAPILIGGGGSGGGGGFGGFGGGGSGGGGAGR